MELTKFCGVNDSVQARGPHNSNNSLWFTQQKCQKLWYLWVYTPINNQFVTGGHHKKYEPISPQKSLLRTSRSNAAHLAQGRRSPLGRWSRSVVPNGSAGHAWPAPSQGLRSLAGHKNGAQVQGRSLK